MTYQAKVLTVSDGVVEGTRADKSGDALGQRLEAVNRVKFCGTPLLS